MVRRFGWDIGGAHLKLAVAEEGRLIALRQIACPLWQGLDRLEAALDQALYGLEPASRHAVTMTGEMADIFDTRAHGVAALLSLMTDRFGADALAIWSMDGFRTLEEARAEPLAVASANWAATAAWVARRRSDALILDVGSTTADLLPVRGGATLLRGHDDASRMASGELVYTGVVRTPVMAVTHEVPFAGGMLPVMAEYFATMADVHRLCFTLPDGADVQPTADGRGRSLEESRARLARMVGRDVGDADEDAWRGLAEAIASVQAATVERAARQVLSAAGLPRSAPIIGTGVGRFVAAEVAQRLSRDYLSLADLMPADADLAQRAADVTPAAVLALLIG